MDEIKQIMKTAILAIIICLSTVYVFAAPTQAPPTDNIAPPISGSSVPQYKEGALRVSGVFHSYGNPISAIFYNDTGPVKVGIGKLSSLDALDIFGNVILSGISPRYVNFKNTLGESGYGIRDNNGVLEIKNTSGSWHPLAGGGFSGIGTANYLTRWTGTNSLSVSKIFDNGTNVGINTDAPNTTLTVYNPYASVNSAQFTQDIFAASINIMTDYSNWTYTPGVFWSTYTNNGTVPKAGILLKQIDQGTVLFFGTVKNYSDGIATTSLSVDPAGNVNVDGKLTGNGGRNGVYRVNSNYCNEEKNSLSDSDHCHTTRCVVDYRDCSDGDCNHGEPDNCANILMGWLH